MTSTKAVPTFVIHRKRVDGWRSTFDGGQVASTGAATYQDACRQAKTSISIALGPDYVACDHYVPAEDRESSSGASTSNSVCAGSSSLRSFSTVQVP